MCFIITYVVGNTSFYYYVFQCLFVLLMMMELVRTFRRLYAIFLASFTCLMQQLKASLLEYTSLLLTFPPATTPVLPVCFPQQRPLSYQCVSPSNDPCLTSVFPPTTTPVLPVCFPQQRPLSYQCVSPSNDPSLLGETHW